MMDVQPDQQAAGHPDHQARDIDKGGSFVPAQIPPGCFKVVPEHVIVSLAVRINDAFLVLFQRMIKPLRLVNAKSYRERTPLLDYCCVGFTS
jgi:hypothetical protein